MPKRSVRVWEMEAERYLTQAELDVARGAQFSIASLAEHCGVNRTTIWRNTKIRDRVDALLKGKEAAREKASKLKRSKSQQKILRLQLQIEDLTHDNNWLIQGYLNAYARLNERGIDPKTIFDDQFFHRRALSRK